MHSMAEFAFVLASAGLALTVVTGMVALGLGMLVRRLRRGGRGAPASNRQLGSQPRVPA